MEAEAVANAACTLLLHIRHELERPRVRERGLLALQALYDFLKVIYTWKILLLF